MRNIDKLKAYKKKTAEEIRTTRLQYKEAQRTKEPITTIWKLLAQLNRLKYEYRHHHIAYCELRGRTRDRIERPNDKHQPNESYINEIKEQYDWTPEEIEAYEERKNKREEAVCIG